MQDGMAGTLAPAILRWERKEQGAEEKETGGRMEHSAGMTAMSKKASNENAQCFNACNLQSCCGRARAIGERGRTKQRFTIYN